MPAQVVRFPTVPLPAPDPRMRRRARATVRGIRRDLRTPMLLWRVRAWVRDHWHEALLVAVPGPVVWWALS